jgi:hypothetical protein
MRITYSPLIAITLLWLTATSGRADDALLAALNEHNQTVVAIEGRFEQLKTIEVLPLPLASNGLFHFERGRGIRWQVLEPISSTLLITDQGIHWADSAQQQSDDGASAVIGKIFLGMISGELQSIGEFFDIAAQGSLNQWVITLTPISDTLATYIDNIVINGASLTESVLVMEHNGDQTHIQLTADSVTRE